ncbi:MAG: RNA polymerase-binding protein RbpA [Actinomycetaceae bacterium]|nr:RNA polymerase-binding protein RbpA [Actinomycetaceae bacterium]
MTVNGGEATATVEYFCARGHITRVRFAASALFSVPATWNCSSCHKLASRERPTTCPENRGQSPSPREGEADSFPKLSDRGWEEVRKRRSQAEGETLVQEALERLRENRRGTLDAEP